MLLLSVVFEACLIYLHSHRRQTGCPLTLPVPTSVTYGDRYTEHLRYVHQCSHQTHLLRRDRPLHHHRHRQPKEVLSCSAVISVGMPAVIKLSMLEIC